MIRTLEASVGNPACRERGVAVSTTVFKGLDSAVAVAE
jgi:hypothetical protein